MRRPWNFVNDDIVFVLDRRILRSKTRLKRLRFRGDRIEALQFCRLWANITGEKRVWSFEYLNVPPVFCHYCVGKFTQWYLTKPVRSLCGSNNLRNHGAKKWAQNKQFEDKSEICDMWVMVSCLSCHGVGSMMVGSGWLGCYIDVRLKHGTFFLMSKHKELGFSFHSRFHNIFRLSKQGGYEIYHLDCPFRCIWHAITRIKKDWRFLLCDSANK